MQLREGELVLFYNRLAEVICPGNRSNTGSVEVTDEGGIAHLYPIPISPYVRSMIHPLTQTGECVLDAINRAANRELSSYEQLRRMAELWLADPQIGDVFHVFHGYRLRITEIRDDETIIGHSLPVRGVLDPQVVSFDDARALRQFFSLTTMPVYRAQAYATSRPNFQGHELLHKGENSPLYTGDHEIHKESRRR